MDEVRQLSLDKLRRKKENKTLSLDRLGSYIYAIYSTICWSVFGYGPYRRLPHELPVTKSTSSPRAATLRDKTTMIFSRSLPLEIDVDFSPL